jgi:toxin CcdB
VADILMARFDVYANPGRHADSTPYLLDVQSDLLDGLDSSDRLTPTLSIAGTEFILETPKMGALPRRVLGAPLLSLAAERARVTAAMDFVFRGF